MAFRPSIILYSHGTVLNTVVEYPWTPPSSLGVIVRIIPEFGGADKKTAAAIAGYMKEHIKEFLEKYDGRTGDSIAEERYQRFRNF